MTGIIETHPVVCVRPATRSRLPILPGLQLEGD